MAVDSFAKRMAVAHVGTPPDLGVFPGEMGNPLGRAAAAWSYTPEPFVPPTGGFGSGASGIGQRKTYSDENLIGGGGSW